MSHICELRLMMHWVDPVNGQHSRVFWNYASHTNNPDMIQRMREFGRQASKDNNKISITFERVTRYKSGYYWRVLNKFKHGEDITDC